MTLQKAIILIINECWTNPNFKSNLLDDHRSAISSLGIKDFGYFGESEIKFVDRNNDQLSNNLITKHETNVVISIPDIPDEINLELSDTEMNNVSGGLIIAPLLFIKKLFS